MTATRQPAQPRPGGPKRAGRSGFVMVWVGIAALVVATSAVAALRSDTTTPASALQGDVDAMVAAGTPGAVLFVRDGNQVTRLTGGVAEIATRRAMAAGDSYRIASLTKTYVATVVLQLAGEGKLRLTDTVERWLPGLVPKGNKITVHQLLNHTSGLYDHERDPQVLKPYLSGNLGYYWSPLRLVKLAVTRKARFAPGASKISSYSSTNYLVLGLIVERVTGNPLGVELKRRIFQPLRLTRTTYPTTQTQLPSPYAHGYFLLGGKPPLVDLSAFSPSLSGPAGAIVSNVDDVAGFYRALFAGRLLKPKLLKAMMKTIPGGPDSDLKQREGYGLERFPTSCGAAWGHSGSFPGYKNYALSSADGKRQIVLMVNIDPTAEPEAARTLFYQLLDKAYCTAA